MTTWKLALTSLVLVLIAAAAGCSKGVPPAGKTTEAAAPAPAKKEHDTKAMAKENPLEILGVADVARLEEGLQVPLRDGTKLIATAVVPTSGVKGPVILVQSPYPNQAEFHGGHDLFQRLIRKGYSVVVVNDRGTQWSEGEYRWQKQA